MSAQNRVPTGIPPLDNLLGGGFHGSAVHLIYGKATSGKTTLTLTATLHHLGHNRTAKAVYLDNLLGGGFHGSAVHLIYGKATSGKTTLTLTATLHHLGHNRSAKAVYLDIDNKLNVGRLQQIASIDENVLRRLNLYTPDSFDDQSDALEQLPDLNPSDIVIIDSITGLYRGETEDTEKTFEANKELNRQLGYISEVAKTTGATVLLTGQVRSILDTTQVEPVAQRLLRYWSTSIIKLEKTAITSNRQATMEKPQGIRSPIILSINASGMVEASN